MRGLQVQFLIPASVVLAGIAVGALVRSAVWGVVVGTVLAVVVAVVLGRRAGRQLERIEAVARRDASLDLDTLSTIGAFDRIDVTLRSVAYSALSDERRRAIERQLFDQQTQVLDRMTDGLMRVAQDGRVTYANVAAGALFGGRNPTDRSFMSVTRDHELNEAVRRCLETGVEQQHTLEIPGEGRLINATVIRLSDQPAEALVTLRDITEVNRLQNLRRDFVSNVSHELRTPLSTIKILTETLLDLREDDDESSEFLRKIDSEVDSMTSLVRDLLDLTRLETMGGRLALREVDVATLVSDVIDRTRPLARRHDVTLVADADPQAGTLAADERRLHQAFINLISNAIVHTPAGGTVTVGARKTDEGVEFFVRDTGSGIPPDDLPRVWERFFKSDRARTGPGTGLGLAIVKYIVQAHSGTVSATSEVGKGSEFTFVIPYALGPVYAPPPALDSPIAPN